MKTEKKCIMHSVPSRFHISFPQHGSGFGNMQNPKSQIIIHFHLICSQVPQPTYSWIHPDTCQLGNPTTDMLQLLFWANIAQFIQRRSYTTKKLKAFLWIFVFLFLWVENLKIKRYFEDIFPSCLCNIYLTGFPFSIITSKNSNRYLDDISHSFRF